ncbi:hypothetical protein PS691_03049 [Pseudomonas fluorescens]|uniref:Uncharacterized protein n=1 Tax=Pseudomonas fluorescens TaxID=294 RepID=A0A5E7CN79_PSEFL|nr:hypothetical protein PS691_03049 [Pseudomonas fluorescens]
MSAHPALSIVECRVQCAIVQVASHCQVIMARALRIYSCSNGNDLAIRLTRSSSPDSVQPLYAGIHRIAFGKSRVWFTVFIERYQGA